MNNFIDMLIMKLKEMLSEDYHLEQVASVKNNSQQYQGIQVRKKGYSAGPVFYVYGLYNDYLSEEKTIEECAEELKTEIKNHQPFNFDMTYIKSYERIRDLVHVMLVNYEANAGQLREQPHVRFLDLAAIFYIGIDFNDEAKGTIIVTNELLEIWNVDKEEFIKEHLGRQIKNERAVYCELGDLLNMMAEDLISKGLILAEVKDDIVSAQKHFYMLTNEAHRYGANMLLNTAYLHKIATELEDNLLIFPASVHEILVAPESDKAVSYFTGKDVAVINLQNVHPEERLSNNVYLYDRNSKEIRIFHKGISLAQLEKIQNMMK